MLNKAVEDNQHAMEFNQRSLSKMYENPEAYTDPLKLFESQIRQYEWMKLVDEDNMAMIK